MKSKLAAYFLVGPTASGKTAVAHFIAEKKGFEILSADSMLVYRGMDIGTAKPTISERLRVSYHGIDLVSPSRPFNVAEFRMIALDCLREAGSRGSRVIVAGGTGLYVKALVQGLRASVGPNAEARARYEAIYQREGLLPLQNELKKRCGEFYETITDKENPRRLIRALEMAESGCIGPGRTWDAIPRHVPLVGLQVSTEMLNSRIDGRVREMYRQGVIGEARHLLAGGSGLSSTARQAIGYAEALGVVDGRWTEELAMQKTATRTRQLAKRQRTWFRHQAAVEWVRVEPEMDVSEIAAQVEKLWLRHGPTDIVDEGLNDAGV